MNPFELISAICLIISCILIIVVVFFQGAQKGGMSQSITGQSNDNYYQRNMGRSKEMKLKKLTAVVATVFFTVAIAVNLVAVYFGNDTEEAPADDNSLVLDDDWADEGDYDDEYADINEEEDFDDVDMDDGNAIGDNEGDEELDNEGNDADNDADEGDNEAEDGENTEE
ncbi:MAG: preprotein translocase subunit SecG [Oscillospiraceae bacterium]|nr:preprotein translocase subunit SecG [Oscillospiraceae bacterium]